MIINSYFFNGVSLDPNAEAFINATGISGSQSVSINDLVLDLKAANLWTSPNAIYPFIGGTATTHKYNLKNPLDTNAAYRLGFAGGWIHNLSGATPDGMNSFADTYLVGSTVLTANNSHVSFYSLTDSDTGGCDFGNTSNAFGSITKAGNTMYSDFLGNGSVFLASPDRITVANPSSNAFFIFSSTATNIKVYKNKNILGQKGSATVSGYPATSILFSYGYTSGTNRWSNRQLAFSSIGGGFSDLDAQIYFQIVEKYQVSQNRNASPLKAFYYDRNLDNATNAAIFDAQP